LEFGRIWNLAKFGTATDFVGNEKKEKNFCMRKNFWLIVFFSFIRG